MDKEIELVNGTTLVIGFDDDSTSPREFDSPTKLFLINNINEFEEELREDFKDWEEHKAWLERKFNAIVLPVYKFEHSGVSYNTTGFVSKWDSCLNGFILIEKEEVRKMYGVNRISPRIKNLALDLMRGEIEVYSQWASGDVYCGEIKDENGESIDYCGGFYDEQSLVEYARSIIRS